MPQQELHQLHCTHLQAVLPCRHLDVQLAEGAAPVGSVLNLQAGSQGIQSVNLTRAPSGISSTPADSQQAAAPAAAKAAAPSLGQHSTAPTCRRGKPGWPLAGSLIERKAKGSLPPGSSESRYLKRCRQYGARYGVQGAVHVLVEGQGNSGKQGNSGLPGALRHRGGLHAAVNVQCATTVPVEQYRSSTLASSSSYNPNWSSGSTDRQQPSSWVTSSSIAGHTWGREAAGGAEPEQQRGEHE